MAKNLKNPHIGGSLEDFLQEEGILEEVEMAATKKALAIQLRTLMDQEHITKSALAERMETSRASLDRLLDPNNYSVTLLTIARAAHALGKKVRIGLT